MYVTLGFRKWPKIKVFEYLSVSCVVLYRTWVLSSILLLDACNIKSKFLYLVPRQEKVTDFQERTGLRATRAFR